MGRSGKKLSEKVSAGITHIPELFAGLLPGEETIEQIALLVFSPKGGGQTLGAAKVLHVSDLLCQIVDHFAGFPMIKRQVPEQFSILRAIQFTTEYRRKLFKSKT